MERKRKKNLGEEGEGGLLVGDRASDGDEFAFLDFSFEGYFLFDSSERTCVSTAGGGDHGSE
jgi:hypothetical protein